MMPEQSFYNAWSEVFIAMGKKNKEAQAEFNKLLRQHNPMGFYLQPKKNTWHWGKMGPDGIVRCLPCGVGLTGLVDYRELDTLLAEADLIPGNPHGKYVALGGIYCLPCLLVALEKLRGE